MSTLTKDGKIYIKTSANTVVELSNFIGRFTRGVELETLILDDSYKECDVKAIPKENEAVKRLKEKKPNFFKALLKYGKK